MCKGYKCWWESPVSSEDNSDTSDLICGWGELKNELVLGTLKIDKKF
jgi:hypothetical protein